MLSRIGPPGIPCDIGYKGSDGKERVGAPANGALFCATSDIGDPLKALAKPEIRR
jgi:hypothetical protein